MQNIASLLSLPTEGNTVNSLLEAKNGPGEGIQGILPGQDASFLKALSNFLETNSGTTQPDIDQDGLLLTNIDLQDLPQDGNALPITEFSISEIKTFLNDLVKELKNLDDTHLSKDQKIITEHLAEQLTEIQNLIQAGADGEDVRIPAWLANDVQKTMQALRENGTLVTQYQEQKHQMQTNAVLVDTNHPDKLSQTNIDTSKPSAVLEDSKINQLSNIVQGLVATSQEHTRTKPELGLTDLFRSSLSLNDVKSADNLIGNITGLYHQTSNPAGDKVMTSLPIHSTFNQPGWGNEVGERIRWLVNQNIQTAELRLNPPQLGPIEVKVTMQNDQMNIMFTAHHVAVRDALESAVPRLREMFGDNGLNLANVDISQHSFSDQRRASPDSNQTYHYAGSDEHTDELAETALLSQRLSLHQGLIDYYA